MGAEILHGTAELNAALQRRNGLLEELHHTEMGRTTSDPRLAAFAGAVLLEYDRSPFFKQIIDRYAFKRADIEQPSMAENVLFRAIQKQELRRELLDGVRYPYPEPHDSIAVWRRDLQELTAPGSQELPEIEDDLAHRHSKANIVDRYKSFLFLLALGRGRFDRPTNIIDFGCSQNHGLKRLAIPPDATLQFDFSETTLIDRSSGTSDVRASHTFNTLLQYTGGVGDSVGIDLDDMHAPDVREWAKTSTFKPQELLDVQTVAKYEILDSIGNLPNARINFLQRNIVTMDIEDFKEQTGGLSGDLVIMSALLHQLSPSNRLAVIEKARQLVKPNGLIVIQDFARVNPADKTSLQFYKHWFANPYRFRTLITSKESQFREFSEVIQWFDGRCKVGKLGPGLRLLPQTVRYGLSS
ncbi:MAG TPA: class I SAM-dependent methyltransferase [Candidatus Saccharimonadales bacterium]|nr:class I SAM-dependent methyltransferase [Candidatus Saccharimonadales bacterium]